MSDLGDLAYRLGVNVGDRFRGSSAEDRQLLRDKEQQRALVEAQGAARMAQLLAENEAYTKRQREALQAQKELQDRGFSHAELQQIINNQAEAERQRAAFNNSLGLLDATHLNTIDRDTLQKDLELELAKQRQIAIAQGQADAAKVAGSAAEVEGMRNRMQKGLFEGDIKSLPLMNLNRRFDLENAAKKAMNEAELLPGEQQIALAKQNILNDPNNRDLFNAKVLGITVGQGDTFFGPNATYSGAQRASGAYKDASGNLVIGDHTIPGSIQPVLTDDDLIERARQLAEARRLLKQTAPVGSVLLNDPGNSGAGTLFIDPTRSIRKPSWRDAFDNPAIK